MRGQAFDCRQYIGSLGGRTVSWLDKHLRIRDRRNGRGWGRGSTRSARSCLHENSRRAGFKSGRYNSPLAHGNGIKPPKAW